MTARTLLQRLASDEGPLGTAELFLRIEHANDADTSIADALAEARAAIRALSADRGEAVAYVKQTLSDGSISARIAPTGYSNFDAIMEKIRADPWVQRGLAQIVPLYLGPPSPAESAEGMVLLRKSAVRSWAREMNGARQGDNPEARAEYVHGSILSNIACAEKRAATATAPSQVSDAEPFAWAYIGQRDGQELVDLSRVRWTGELRKLGMRNGCREVPLFDQPQPVSQVSDADMRAWLSDYRDILIDEGKSNEAKKVQTALDQPQPGRVEGMDTWFVSGSHGWPGGIEFRSRDEAIAHICEHDGQLHFWIHQANRKDYTREEVAAMIAAAPTAGGASNG